MNKTNEKNNESPGEKNNISQEGTATHSGWMHFYSSFAKYRDESIRLGQLILGNNLNQAMNALTEYHSSLYSMAQQLFSFYDSNIEDEITDKWLKIGEDINTISRTYNDKDFRNEMILVGKGIDIKLKKDLLKFFNRIDRLAADAGLLVGKEEKGRDEPKKGMVGL